MLVSLLAKMQSQRQPNMNPSLEQAHLVRKELAKLFSLQRDFALDEDQCWEFFAAQILGVTLEVESATPKRRRVHEFVLIFQRAQRDGIGLQAKKSAAENDSDYDPSQGDSK
jgi:RNAse (barnase) inhibitor barstar